MRLEIIAAPTKPEILVPDPIDPYQAQEMFIATLEAGCRTRQTLKYVERKSKAAGKKSGLLPAKFFTAALPGVRAPTFTKGCEEPYSLFGLALEAGLLPFFAKAGYNVIGADPDQLSEAGIPKLFYFVKWETAGAQILANLSATVEAISSSYPPAKWPVLEYQAELKVSAPEDADSPVTVGPLQCHPDFVLRSRPPRDIPGPLSSSKKGEVVVLECKSISRASVKDTWPHRAQLCVYVGAFRELGYLVRAAGIVLPWERDPRLVEIPAIDKYNHVPLLTYALESRHWVAEDPIQRLRWTSIYAAARIGHHITNSEVESYLGISPGYPVQIFLGGMTTSAAADAKVHAKFRASPRDFSARGRVHIHGPYNLLVTCEQPYVRDAILQYLKTATLIKSPSVVFHIGTITERVRGIRTMRTNLRHILTEYAKFVATQPTYAKLLLETGAGKGTEPMPSPEEMARELSRYDPKLLGVCVDTCHVHDAGFSPVDYVKRYLAAATDTAPAIGLFHFNGAALPRGSCADSHATPKGHQEIPYEELQWIVGYAVANNIDCVTE